MFITGRFFQSQSQRLSHVQIFIYVCMYACVHVTITGAFAHMAERKIAYSVITKGGRIGIMTSLNVLMEDIQLLQPTTFSTTPRWV